MDLAGEQAPVAVAFGTTAAASLSATGILRVWATQVRPGARLHGHHSHGKTLTACIRRAHAPGRWLAHVGCCCIPWAECSTFVCSASAWSARAWRGPGSSHDRGGGSAFTGAARGHSRPNLHSFLFSLQLYDLLDGRQRWTADWRAATTAVLNVSACVTRVLLRSNHVCQRSADTLRAV